MLKAMTRTRTDPSNVRYAKLCKRLKGAFLFDDHFYLVDALNHESKLYVLNYVFKTQTSGKYKQ